MIRDRNISFEVESIRKKRESNLEKIFLFERERIVLLEKTRARISEILGIVSALVNFVKLRIDRMLEYLSNRIVFFFFCARALFKIGKKNSVSLHRNKMHRNTEI